MYVCMCNSGCKVTLSLPNGQIFGAEKHPRPSKIVSAPGHVAPAL